MPAPGGKFAGSSSDSRGYAGSSSSRSGAGGGGGTRRDSSGGGTQRESQGSVSSSSRAGAGPGPGGGPQRSNQGGQGGQTGGNFGRGDTPSSGRGTGGLGLGGNRGTQSVGGPTLGGASLADRARAISRGPGPLGDLHQTAISRAVAFGESPAGLREPGLAKKVQQYALHSPTPVGMFTAPNLTPEQQGLLDNTGVSILGASIASGLSPRTIMGQMLTESTTSKNKTHVSALAQKFNNLFGMKAFGQPNDFWSGATKPLKTQEFFGRKPVDISQPFRAYETPNASVLDYGRLMSTPRYAAASMQPDPASQIGAIRAAGYANHPAYAQMASDRAAGVSVGDVPTGSTPTAPEPTAPEARAPVPREKPLSIANRSFPQNLGLSYDPLSSIATPTRTPAPAKLSRPAYEGTMPATLGLSRAPYANPMAQALAQSPIDQQVQAALDQMAAMRGPMLNPSRGLQPTGGIKDLSRIAAETPTRSLAQPQLQAPSTGPGPGYAAAPNINLPGSGVPDAPAPAPQPAPQVAQAQPQSGNENYVTSQGTYDAPENPQPNGEIQAADDGQGNVVVAVNPADFGRQEGRPFGDPTYRPQDPGQMPRFLQQAQPLGLLNPRDQIAYRVQLASQLRAMMKRGLNTPAEQQMANVILQQLQASAQA